MQLNPYINFPGTARQAMELYRSVLGGELALSTFTEFGMQVGPEDADKIMHGQLEVADGTVIMGADAPSSMGTPVQSGFSISLSGGPDEDERLRRVFEQLSDGGTVDEPLVQAPWGDHFGMCTDRFGTHWMVNIGAAQPADAPA